MKTKPVSIFRLLPLMGALAFSNPARSMEATTSPSVTPYGTLGMSNVTSSEALGEGMMTLHLGASYYKQNTTVPGVLDNTQITAVSGGAGLGLNGYLDAFVGMNIYNYNVPGSTGSGFGSVILGAKGTLPAAEGTHLRMGLQMAGIFGTGNNQFNATGADGYNYLETRSSGSSDLLVRLTQSLLLTDDSKGGTGFNVHLNEGVVSSFESGKGVLLISGIGVEFIPAPPLILGLEASSRTFLSDPAVTDPLWVTPSVTWRTPKFVNVNLGADVAVSPDRDAPRPQALAPWRIFGGLTGSIDTQKGKKRDAADKARGQREAAVRARRDSVENVALHRRVISADDKADSLARVTAAADARKKTTADSLANKAHQDSVILAATQRALSAEKSKRSDAEKQLLSTGLLLMDAVYFETGKTEISINSKPYLNIIAKMLVKYPKLNVEVAGHTDNVGGEALNMGLSQGRAESVRSYMVTAAPELNGHLTARGYGMTSPKADNSTESGRMLNRRTELQVLNKAALREYNR